MAMTPDPRLFPQEKSSLAEQLLDLDETERVRARVIARRMERTYRKSENFKEDMLPALWCAAHDRAIGEVAQAREQAKLNGRIEWDERTWKDDPSKA
jgi:hypothetical protein